MGRLKVLLLFVFGVIFSNCYAEKDTSINLAQENFIPGSYVNFYVDNLNNIYFIDAASQIKKTDAQGDSLAVSNALNKYGNIYSMDVSNALKLLVYYKDFATIVVLDRFLKTINTIDLRTHNILQAQAVATSYDNNYWVFDEVENKLKKIDDYGNLLLSTPDLRTVFSEVFMPEKIIDYNGSVYLFTKNKGCKVFDYYGALKQSIPPLNYNDVEIVKNYMYGFDSVAIHAYNIPAFSETSSVFSPSLKNTLKLQKIFNDLYVLSSNGLFTYSINK